MNWATIATVALTAATTILATLGVITADEGTNLTTTGAAAVTGVAGFITAIVVTYKNHKKAKAEKKAE